MRTELSEKIARAVRLLPKEEQEKVLVFAESLVPTRQTYMDVIREIEATIPDDVLEKLPVDGALNLDHYLYGAPKK